MPTHDEVVQALANRIYELQAEDGRRLNILAPLLNGPFYTVFASLFIAASAEQVPVGSSTILQHMHTILHDRRYGMQGFDETVIAGELVTAEPALSLQEKVNLIFDYFILNEPRAQIPRILNRNMNCQHLYTKLLPEQAVQIAMDREYKRNKMLQEFFHKVTGESFDHIKEKCIDLIDAGMVYIAGREVAIRCAITQTFMVNPVKIEEDNAVYYFERDALNAWMIKNQTNPLTNLPLKSQPKPAPEMESAIRKLITERAHEVVHKVKYRDVMQELVKKKHHEKVQPIWGSGRKELTWTPIEQEQGRPEPRPFKRGKRNKNNPS